jgi:deoxyhypusine synthase
MDLNKVPTGVQTAIFMQSTDISEIPAVLGYDFNKSNNLEEVIKSYYTTGFQATNMAQAISILNDMVICIPA